MGTEPLVLCLGLMQRMEGEGLTPSMPLARLNIFLIFSWSLLPAYFMLWLSSVGDQGEYRAV